MKLKATFSFIILLFQIGINSHLIYSQTIDFEPQTGFDPIEGQAVDNLFMAQTYGVTFHLETLGGPPPTMSKTGNPRTAFANSTPWLGCGISTSNDDCTYNGLNDCFFLTDDGLLAPVTYDLVVDYENSCCSSASGELLDVDQGEGWEIFVYSNGQSTPYLSLTVCSQSTCDFPSQGDGTQTPWSFDISPESIDYVIFHYFDAGGGPIAVGIGFDNFTFCGEDGPAVISADTISICSGTNIVWQGQEINSPGLYIDTMNSSDFCDTIFHLYAQQGTTFVNSTIYDCTIGDSYTTEYFISGDSGCDTIHFELTIPIGIDTQELVIHTCDENLVGLDTFISIPGMFCDTIIHQFYESGISEKTFEYSYSCLYLAIDTIIESFINEFGCDSLHLTYLIPDPLDTVESEIFVCDVIFTGVDTFFRVEGPVCDTVYHVVYSILPSDTIWEIESSCTVNQADTTFSLLTNQFGCDSLLFFVSLPISTDTIQLLLDTCDATLENQDTMIRVPGIDCDTIFHISFSILPTDTLWEFESSCSISQPDTSFTLLTNQFGCDSIVVNIQIPNPVDTVERTMFTCNERFTGKDSLAYNSGPECDTPIYISYIIFPKDTIWEHTQLCSVNEIDTILTILTNQFGCDSFYFLVQHPGELDTIREVEFTCDTNLLGKDTFLVLNGNECDTVLQLMFEVLYPVETYLTQDTCSDVAVPGKTRIFQGQNGCDSIVYYSFNISSIEVELQPDTTINLGNNVLLIAETSKPPASINWTPAGPDSLNWLVSPAGSHIYSIMVSDSLGCEATSQVFIEVNTNVWIWAPNAFSPNNDGINDTWEIFSSESIEIQEIVIFERWGNKVWESTGYRPWDGTFNQKIVDNGVYVAVVTYREYITGESKSFTSEIHLLR